MAEGDLAMARGASTHWPETQRSLLGKLRTGDDDAWRTFVLLYGPMMLQFCRRVDYQLPEDDAAEVVNRVMLKVGRFEYRPERGRFRDWLRTVLRREILDERLQRGRRKDASTGGGDPPSFDALEAADDRSWDEVFVEHVRLAAVERVRGRFTDEQWQAFEARAPWRRDRCGVEQIARELGCSKSWVSKTCRQIENALMDEVRYLSEELAADGDFAEWEAGSCVPPSRF